MSESPQPLPGVAEAPDWTPWGEPRRAERGVETAYHHSLILLRRRGDAALRVVAPGDVLADRGAALEWSPMPWAHRGRRLSRTTHQLGPGWAFRGADDRLFPATDAVGEQIFEGESLGEASLEGWTQTLARRTTHFAQAKIVYRLLVVPESHAIYADKIDGQPRPSPQRPLLRIWNRADPATRASIVYPLDALIAGRARHEVSHPHDVHLTTYGYFLVYRELMRTIPGIDPGRLLREEDLKVRTALVAGDIARSVGAPARRVNVWDAPVPPHKALVKGTSYKPNQIDVFEGEDRSLPKLLLFRTSNSSHLFMHFLRHFSRVAALASPHVYYDLVESERPDVVIVEMPERYFAHAASGPNVTDRGLPPRDPQDEFEARVGQALPLPRETT
jgi:hypothetical protein